MSSRQSLRINRSFLFWEPIFSVGQQVKGLRLRWLLPQKGLLIFRRQITDVLRVVNGCDVDVLDDKAIAGA
jgi:hypothetical protein